ncbi:hypothetical protein DFH08DRAFT_417012 [Mycena albidolilacea]|uniref:Uncharacterized protein n=1 Tax=Mycena albidolilacea TaxID=1033008 RepID=A0AAD7F130_9AGAR|nr:hypothetical protein DFH08DRAFT_417012 [Mycena albidolilacea]
MPQRMDRVPEILPFVQRSSCSLKTLVLRLCTINFHLITFLRGLPSLTRLVIENDTFDSTLDQVALLDAKYGLCPNLTSLACSLVGSKGVDTNRFFAMAQSRFRLQPPSTSLKQLRLLGGSVEPCPLYIALKIQAMCDEGFDVSFVDPHEEDLLKGRGTFP